MTQDDIIERKRPMDKGLTRAELAKLFIESFESVEKGVNRMVREACNGTDTWKNGAWHLTDGELRRFAALVAEAERDKVAHWIMDRGFTTEDADGIEELLQEFERQACESIEDIIEAYEAAPDLLEALEDLLAYFGPDTDNGLDELLTNARAAIAKARGEQ